MQTPRLKWWTAPLSSDAALLQKQNGLAPCSDGH